MVLEIWTGIKGTATMKLYDKFQEATLAGNEGQIGPPGYQGRG